MNKMLVVIAFLLLLTDPLLTLPILGECAPGPFLKKGSQNLKLFSKKIKAHNMEEPFWLR